MKIYFTSSSTFLGAQTDPLSSLGGYVSSSALPNGSLNGVFPEVTIQDIKKGSTTYICLALKNETGVDQTISLYYDNTSTHPLTTYQMALVSPFVNVACNNENTAEVVNNIFSKPLSATFASNLGVGNGLATTIVAGEYIVIWIERNIAKLTNNHTASYVVSNNVSYDTNAPVGSCDFYYKNFATNLAASAYPDDPFQTELHDITDLEETILLNIDY